MSGRSTYAHQAVGDPHLLPTIAAMAIVIPITLLQSIHSVMQMEEAFRQVICGVVIIVMLLVYGRGQRVAG